MAYITRYNPFSEVVPLRVAVDRLFEDRAYTRGNRGGNTNLYETEEGYALQLPMPGVKAEDVEITVEQNRVNVKWETRVQFPEGATVHWNGFQPGQYQQSFRLPAPLNSDAVEAQYNDGILTLRLPKAEHARPRTIKVSAQ